MSRIYKELLKSVFRKKNNKRLEEILHKGFYGQNNIKQGSNTVVIRRMKITTTVRNHFHLLQNV